MKCHCYVSRLSEFKRFVIRYGAHHLACPVYRRSQDPVDAIKDDYTRQTEGVNLVEA